MKNVTITLDEETIRWARIEAAKQGVSLSKLTSELLRERRCQEAEYEAAMQRFLGREGQRMSRNGKRYPGRETLYDRKVLR